MELQELKFTGERYVPHLGGEIELEHMNRYHFANGFVKDKVVLDIACGEGYGSALFAKTAQKVYGIDIDSNTIKHAKAKYTQSNIAFLEGSCLNIKLPDNSVDVLVSFETLEHIEEHNQYITEIKRVLKPNGVLLLSTPNTDEYSKDDYKNEFHLLELNEQEFKDLLQRNFEHTVFYSQKVASVSFIVNAEKSLGNSHFVSKTETVKPKYLIAVASNAPLGELSDLSLYLNQETDLIANLHKEYQGHIDRREKEIVEMVAFFQKQLGVLGKLKDNTIAKKLYRLYKKLMS